MDNITFPEDENATYFNASLVENSTSASARMPGFPPLLIFFISLQQMVFVFSLVGNLAVIIIFAMYMKKSITNKFIINLAVNDICTGLSSGSQIFYFFYPDLTTNMYTCFLRYQIVCAMTYASQFNVTFVTLDRYIAICKNTEYDKIMTTKTSNVMIAVAWIIPTVTCALPFMGFNKWNEGSRCSKPYVFSEWYYLVLGTTIYVLMSLSLTMYALILRKAFTFMRRSLKSTGDQNTERRAALRKTIKSAKVTATVTMVFILCWAPYQVYNIKYGFGDPSDFVDFDLSNWLVFLGIFNSIVNPFIYAWQKQEFRDHLKSKLCPIAWKREGDMTSSKDKQPSIATVSSSPSEDD